MMPVLLFLRRFSLRHAARDWLQTLLLLLILGLGVGTFLSIRLANRAAAEGFQLFTDSLRGPSDWVVESTGAGIPVESLPVLRQALDGIPARLFPVVERTLHPLPDGTAEAAAGAAVRLLGLDLVQLRATTSAAGIDGPRDFWDLLDDPRHLLVSPAVARQWRVAVGDPVELILQGQREPFVIRGLLPEFRDRTPLPANLAIADIGALLGRLGLAAVDRVEVVIPAGAQRGPLVAEAGGRLRALGDPNLSVTTPGDRRADGEGMTAAFRLNLAVLSLIALLVGMYLIAQTLDATVSRRRREIATLRSLGVTPREIRRLWLAEAFLYGLAAGLLGLLTGTILARFTVGAVTTTVRALYRETVQTAVVLTPGDVLLCCALGIVGSLVAALIPARDAALTPPAQFLRMGRRIPPFPLFQHPWVGAAALLAGAALLLAPPWSPHPGRDIPVAGYAAAFLWLTGGTLVAVSALKGVGVLIHALSGGNPAARLAGSRLRAPTSRHQLALSGFFVAVAMAAAMAFLISSFEHTVTRWLEQRLRADLFVSSVGFQGSGGGQRMPGRLLDAIGGTPGVAAVDRYRQVDARISGIATAVGGARHDLLGRGQELLWIGAPPDPALRPPQADATGYANENLARRAGLRAGDVVTLDTPAGARRVWIGGLHADYARDNGLLLLDLPVLEQWYQVSDYDTASLFLAPGADPAALQERLRAEFPGLAVRRNAELMEAALFIFHQTFAVTRALQAIGLAVALAGLALSLLSLLRESGRELALQRTLGMSRHETALATAIEGLGVALAGLLCGLLLAAALGQLLVRVINRQSFGWTLQTAWPWSDTLLLAGGVLLLGLVIAYATGWLYLRKWRPEPL